MTRTLTVKNFRGIRGTISISPETGAIIITGQNGAGKSSFVEAFQELFDPKGVRLTPNPIHNGADDASAEFIDTELGIRVVRVWKKNDAGTLSLYALDGAKYDKPTERVAKLIGGMMFDHLAFLALDAKKQRDQILEKVELPFDLDELARKKSGAEERRRLAGQDVKRISGALASMPAPTADAATEFVSAAELSEQLSVALGSVSERDRLEALVSERARTRAIAEQQVERLEAELSRAREGHAAERDLHVQAEEAFSTFTAIDPEPIRAQMATVDQANEAIRASRAHAATTAELAAAETLVAAEQAELDRIEKVKADGLKTVVFPDPALSVDDEHVLYNGVPLIQANTAVRRRVAFNIATAGEHALKFVIVKGGDDLDAESLDQIIAMADERGVGVLIDRGRPDMGGLVASVFELVDGQLAA